MRTYDVWISTHFIYKRLWPAVQWIRLSNFRSASMTCKSSINLSNVQLFACSTCFRVFYRYSVTCSPRKGLKCWREMFLLPVPFAKALDLTNRAPWGVCWFCCRWLKGVSWKSCAAPQVIKRHSGTLVWRRHCSVPLVAEGNPRTGVWISYIVEVGVARFPNRSHDASLASKSQGGKEEVWFSQSHCKKEQVFDCQPFLCSCIIWGCSQSFAESGTRRSGGDQGNALVCQEVYQWDF